MYNSKDIFEIVSQFEIPEKVRSIDKFGNGLINDTYLVKTVPDDAQNYILQKINKHVFKFIENLTSNKVLITQLMGDKLGNNRKFPQFIPTDKNLYYFLDKNEQYWNLSQYIENSHIYQKVESPAIAFEASKILGEFHSVVHKIPVEKIYDTIINFHNLKFRLDQFDKVLSTDQYKRNKLAENEIAVFNELKNEMLAIPELIENNKIPVRVTHNDTKINNILFDENNKGICMIDLDTVMAGPVVYDFGDAMRSGVNTAEEDESNLELVHVDLDLFENYTRGYLSKAVSFLKEIEINNMVQGILTLTYEQALRFLTDFIDGDKYYKTKYEDHNLVRTRSQLHLLKSFMTQREKMENCIKEYIS